MSKDEIKTFEDVWTFIWKYIYKIIEKLFPEWKNITTEPEEDAE